MNEYNKIVQNAYRIADLQGWEWEEDYSVIFKKYTNFKNQNE